MSQNEQDLLKQIANELHATAPDGWSRITLTQRSIGRYNEVAGLVEYSGGRSESWLAPLSVNITLSQLRGVLYKPGEGTWFTAQFWLEPTRYQAQYDFDTEPTWQNLPEKESFAEELTAYPRTKPPAWLTARAAGRDTPWLTFHEAKVCDGFTDGRPFVDRPPLNPDELPLINAYLDKAPTVLAARSYTTDIFDPDAPPRVPLWFATDGKWIFAGAVAYNVRKHGISLEPEFLEHIRSRNYQVGEVSADAIAAATRVVLGAREAAPPEPERDMPSPFSEEAPLTQVVAGPTPEATQVVRQVTAKPAAVAAPRADPENLLALKVLRARLEELGVPASRYRIGTGPDDVEVVALEPDGMGWLVRTTGPDAIGAPVRFDDAADAAVYLLGALLLNSPSPME